LRHSPYTKKNMVTGGTHGAAGVREKRKSSRSELQYDINEDGAIQRENSNKTRWTTAYDRLRRAKDRDKRQETMMRRNKLRTTAKSGHHRRWEGKHAHARAREDGLGEEEGEQHGGSSSLA